MTLGHVDILERAAKLFDRVIVGVGKHPTKRGWFTPEQRRELIAQSSSHLPTVDVAVFSNLVIDFCKEVGAGFIVRGLRAHGDFESEFQMALANRDLAPDIETVFIIPRPNRMIVSSSLVREVAMHGGDYARYVAPAVAKAIDARVQADAQG
jgi:pantetheine-phosphate adenylyltransferase